MAQRTEHRHRFESGSEADTRSVAARVASRLYPGHLVALIGDLGAGKTVFVRGLCEALDVPREDGVSSPTYALVNVYPGGALPIAHVDLYRVAEVDELEGLGFRDLLAGEHVVVVEWPERAPEILELADVVVTIEDHGPRERVLFVDGLPGLAR